MRTRLRLSCRALLIVVWKLDVTKLAPPERQTSELAKRQPIRMLGRSNGNHDWLLANASACVSSVFRLRNARNASDFVWMETVLYLMTVCVYATQIRRCVRQYIVSRRTAFHYRSRSCASSLTNAPCSTSDAAPSSTWPTLLYVKLILYASGAWAEREREVTWAGAGLQKEMCAEMHSRSAYMLCTHQSLSFLH